MDAPRTETRVEVRDEGLVLGVTLDALEVRLVEVTPLAAGELEP